MNNETTKCARCERVMYGFSSMWVGPYFCSEACESENHKSTMLKFDFGVKLYGIRFDSEYLKNRCNDFRKNSEFLSKKQSSIGNEDMESFIPIIELCISSIELFATVLDLKKEHTFTCKQLEYIQSSLNTLSGQINYIKDMVRR